MSENGSRLADFFSPYIAIYAHALMYVYEYSPLSLAILYTPTTLTLCKDLELWGVMPGSVLDAQCTWSLHLRIAPRVFYFSAILIHALSGRCGQI